MSKAFAAHIAEMEKKIDVPIPSSSGFIVSATSDKRCDFIPFIQSIKDRDEITVSYTFSSDDVSNIVLIFIPNDKRREMLLSSIISRYTCELTRYCDSCSSSRGCSVTTKVIPNNSRLAAFSYLYRCMFDCSKIAICAMLNGEVTRGMVSKLTFFEIVEKLKQKGIQWDDIPFREKFGTFVKRDGTIVEIVLEYKTVDEQASILFD